MELLRGNQVDVRASCPRCLDRPVRRTGVDHEHLEVLVDLLRRDGIQAADEVLAAVANRDQDRYQDWARF
jgi:hypothetical protein